MRKKLGQGVVFSWLIWRKVSVTSRDWCEHEIRHIVGALPCGILFVPPLLLMGRGLGRTLRLPLAVLARQSWKSPGSGVSVRAWPCPLAASAQKEPCRLQRRWQEPSASPFLGPGPEHPTARCAMEGLSLAQESRSSGSVALCHSTWAIP